MRIRNFIPILLLIGGLSSCVSQKSVRLLQQKSVKTQPEVYTQPPSQAYELQTGDLLYIKVFSVDPKTSRLFQTDLPSVYTNTAKYLDSYQIDNDGYINFSFIDKIKVKGLTLEGANDVVQSAINEYFKEATVVVKLVNFRISVLGEVASPGTFVIENRQINILQALAKAGGISTFGNRKSVILVRKVDDGSTMHYLDLTDNALLTSEYYYLMPNDVIYVEPRGLKSVAFERIPYSLLFSLSSLALTVVSVMGL